MGYDYGHFSKIPESFDSYQEKQGPAAQHLHL